MNISLPTGQRGALLHGLPVQSTTVEADQNVILLCSDADRFGLRGPGTISWLQSVNAPVPERVNTSTQMPCGTVLARLGQQEALVLSDPTQPPETLARLRTAWHESEGTPRGFDAYRGETWAWFVLSGPDAPEAMARLTTLDVSPKAFPVLSVAQTRAAHMDAVILRSDRFGSVSYDLFLDIASTAFVTDVLAETCGAFPIRRLAQNKRT